MLCRTTRKVSCIREREAASRASSPKFLVSDNGVRTGEKSFFLGVTPPPPRILDATVTRAGDLTPGPAVTEPVDAIRIETAERCEIAAVELDFTFMLVVSVRSDLDFLCQCEWLFAGPTK